MCTKFGIRHKNYNTEYVNNNYLYYICIIIIIIIDVSVVRPVTYNVLQENVFISISAIKIDIFKKPTHFFSER